MTDLHHEIEMLKSDAKQLAQGMWDHIGVIELEPDWEEQIPRLIHRYEKKITRAYNSFPDPDKDEAGWNSVHYRVTMEFLILHGLAKKVEKIRNDI